MSRGNRTVELGQVDARFEVGGQDETLAAQASAALDALDRGDEREARRLLEALAGRLPDAEFEAIGETELEDAFAEAEPDAESMRDANAVAYDAIRAAALDAPEGLSAPATPGSPFHTRTMAALLERQGDAAAARSIRASLAQREEEAAPDATRGTRRRSDRIRTLERWLGRVRRGDA